MDETSKGFNPDGTINPNDPDLIAEAESYGPHSTTAADHINDPRLIGHEPHIPRPDLPPAPEVKPGTPAAPLAPGSDPRD